MIFGRIAIAPSEDIIKLETPIWQNFKPFLALLKIYFSDIKNRIFVDEFVYEFYEIYQHLVESTSRFML